MSSILDSESDALAVSRSHFLESLRFPLAAVVFIWLIHLHQTIAGWDPGNYGVISRTVYGMRGIVTAPLVHGSWKHLLSNTAPFFILSALSLYFYRKVAMRAFWVIYFATGVSVWLFAREVSHIGASGVVYGLVAFIFWNGIFRRSLRSIILALIVMFFYSGMFLGILPDQEGISWESHLLGSLSGVLASFWFKSELEDEELAENRGHRFEPSEKQYFMPRDAFDKTKAQRIAEAEEERRLREAARYNPWGDENQPPYWNSNSSW